MMSHFFQTDDFLSVPASELTGLQAAVVAIGNFDGVHRGHQIVLEAAVTLAHQRFGGSDMRTPAIAMTFEPHPRTVFKPEAPVYRLTPVDSKMRLLQAVGMDGCVIVPFSRAFSQMSAADFVDDLLIGKLNASHVVVGYDFHFGKGREGSPAFLMGRGQELGFGVTIVPPQKDEDNEPVFSSSRVRAFLADGDVDSANAILGYRHFVSGEIIHGEKRGRDMGYPTANIALAPECELKHGIYAVQVLIGNTLHDGVASFGRRPTFDNGAPLLETFIFEFSGDLYGKRVEVILHRYLRGEVKFTTVDALIEQMHQDSADARAVLKEATKATPIDQALAHVI